MGLFSMSRIYFSPSFYFFPQMGELRQRGLRHMSFFVLVSAMLICFVKTKLRAPALPLTETQWMDSELKTKSLSNGALRFGLNITTGERAEKANHLGNALSGCIGCNSKQDVMKLIRVQKRCVL